MTWKKISQQPREATTPANIAKTDEYLEIVSRIDPRNLNFFLMKVQSFWPQEIDRMVAHIRYVDFLLDHENKNSTARMGDKIL